MDGGTARETACPSFTLSYNPPGTTHRDGSGAAAAVEWHFARGPWLGADLRSGYGLGCDVYRYEELVMVGPGVRPAMTALRLLATAEKG